MVAERLPSGVATGYYPGGGPLDACCLFFVFRGGAPTEKHKFPYVLKVFGGFPGSHGSIKNSAWQMARLPMMNDGWLIEIPSLPRPL